MTGKSDGSPGPEAVNNKDWHPSCGLGLTPDASSLRPCYKRQDGTWNRTPALRRPFLTIGDLGQTSAIRLESSVQRRV